MSSDDTIGALVAGLPEANHPDWTNPMLASLTDRHSSDLGWRFERRLDGERLLIFRCGDRERLMMRNRNRVNDTCPELVAAIRDQVTRDFVVDGEVVAFDGKVTSFSRLQGRIQIRDPEAALNSGIAVYLHVFDILHLDGHDLTGQPLRDRKSILRRALQFVDPTRVVALRRGGRRVGLLSPARTGARNSSHRMDRCRPHALPSLSGPAPGQGGAGRGG